MKVCNLTAAALLAGGSASAWTHKTEDELRRRINEDEHTLVAFVAPKTLACEKLETEWEKVEKDDPSALSIDCTSLPSVCADFDVASYPSIRLYQRDAPTVRYRGPRKANSISSFMRRISRPAVTELTGETINAFSTIDDVVFIAQLHSSDETILRDQFSTTANWYRDRYSFGLSGAAKGTGGVHCYNSAEEYQLTTTVAELDQRVNALDEFIKNCTVPVIPQLTVRNEMTYLQSGKSIIYYFSDKEDDRDRYTKNFRILAKTYRDFIQLVTIDSSDYPDMAASLGLATSRGLSLHNPHTDQVFPYKGNVEPGSIANFVVSISKGEIKPWDGRTETSVQPSHDEL